MKFHFPKSKTIIEKKKKKEEPFNFRPPFLFLSIVDDILISITL